jgi:hypothetical protein
MLGLQLLRHISTLPRSSREDPFSGVAQTLVKQGSIPAVIAMQFEITDAAAIKFAEEFYSATADGYPVDAALAAARKAIFAEGNDIEWGTPVLYLRAPDARLFSINREAAQREKERLHARRRRRRKRKRRAETACVVEQKTPAVAASPSSAQITQPVPAQKEEKPPLRRDGDLPNLAVFRDAPFAPELVVIPAGEYMMGSLEGEEGVLIARAPSIG